MLCCWLQFCSKNTERESYIFESGINVNFCTQNSNDDFAFKEYNFTEENFLMVMLATSVPSSIYNSNFAENAAVGLFACTITADT